MTRDPRTVEPTTPHMHPEESSRHGRLAFRRPQPPVAAEATSGLRAFDDGAGGLLGLVHVPPGPAETPLRVVLLLHGAGGSPRQGIELMLPVADPYGLLLVAPKSRQATWDVIVDGYGPDVRRIDGLLKEVAAVRHVEGFSVGGFSDGASYAVSLGVANGDLFDSVVAFSPGFAAPLVRHGTPRFFVSHGVHDTVLPIDRCTRRLVPSLRRSGYEVEHVEFDGPHTVPVEIVERAARWLTVRSGEEPAPRR